MFAQLLNVAISRAHMQNRSGLTIAACMDMSSFTNARSDLTIHQVGVGLSDPGARARVYDRSFHDQDTILPVRYHG
jgi:hypothetical protein